MCEEFTVAGVGAHLDGVQGGWQSLREAAVQAQLSLGVNLCPSTVHQQ